MFWTMGTEMMRAGAALVEQGFELNEMLTASGEVLARRTGIIADAVRDPLNADYAELGRLVPEKIAALSISALLLGVEGARLQGQALAAWREMGWLMIQPTPARIAAFAGRAARNGHSSLGAGRRAMAPVHRAVTANARRLKAPRHGHSNAGQ